MKIDVALIDVHYDPIDPCPAEITYVTCNSNGILRANRLRIPEVLRTASKHYLRLFGIKFRPSFELP